MVPQVTALRADVAPSGCQSAPHGRESGFGLIEALISFVLVGFMAVGISSMILDSRWAVANDKARNQANYKAARIIDSLQARGIGGVADTTGKLVPCVQTGDERPFSCSVTVTTLDAARTGRPITKQVQVDIGWEIRKAPRSIQVQGVIE